MEPIVSRDTIRDLARAAVESGKPLQQANPYPPETSAHRRFEIDYWARERELNGEAYA